jgi:uncharacterized protein (TIGR03067 family)
MRARLLGILSVGMLLGADGKNDDPAAKDLERLQGTWAIESLEINGKQEPEERTKDTKLTVKGDKYVVKVRDKEFEVTIKLDPTKKPKHIDMVPADGPAQGKTHPGIYAVDGERFKLCRGQAPDKERPADFGSWPDSGVFYIVWKKVKE